MPDDLDIASSLSELDRGLRSMADPAELLGVLRALQRLRLSEADLCVHIECVRAANDVTEQDDTVEQNCLLALDLVSGHARDGLRWDSPTMAPAYLQSVLDRETLAAGLAHATIPNDLLPPRPHNHLPDALVERLLNWTEAELGRVAYSVKQAAVFRAPKDASTTRPAALLALPDRVALEALSEMISARLDEVLPSDVLWPRAETNRSAAGIRGAYRSRPLDWSSQYIVKADIANFYGSVDHALLSLVTSAHLGMSRTYGQALESLLSALMGVRRGLPQGVPASDRFASAFLLPIDLRLSSREIPFIRFADDYLIAASSMQEARGTLQLLEEDLRTIGLALNDEKTSIMRSATYEQGLESQRRAVSGLVRTLEQSYEIGGLSALVTAAEENADPAACTEPETVWDCILDPLWDDVYPDDTPLDDTLQGMEERLSPQVAAIHSELLSALVHELGLGQSAPRGAEEIGRRCLALLSQTRTPIDLDHIGILLQWHPKLAPIASTYLRSIACRSPAEVDDFLVRFLNGPPRADWTTGWLCAALQTGEIQMSEALTTRLEAAAENPHEGMLTRSSAVYALAQTGKLKQRIWGRVVTKAVPAMQTELLLSAAIKPITQFDPEGDWGPDLSEVRELLSVKAG